MRIMLCPSAYAPHVGGVEELTHRLAVQYQRAGHAVLVVTARWPADLPAQEVVGGVAVRRVDYALPNRRLAGLLRFATHFPLRLYTLDRLVREFRPDVAHIQCVSGQGLYLLLLRKLRGLRLVVTLQGERRGDAHGLYQRSRLMEPLLARLLRAADFVTACSQATLDDVADLWSPGANSRAVPNGIDLAEFAALPAAPPFDRSYIFAVGRQVHVKGFDVLIAAFARVAAAHPGVDLVIGGDGPERAALAAQIAMQGLAGRVHLPGWLDRAATRAYFAHCRFFVLSSRAEGFGITNLEAMAAGKAVVATRVGGVAEVVQDGATGLLVPPDDAPALAADLARLLADPALATALGQAGQARAQAYDWARIAADYEAIYRRVGSRQREEL